MKIAIACCGLEHVRRGYESFSRELFNALSGRADVTLFKGSGERAPNEVVVPCLRRHLFSRFVNPNRAFYWEQITFAFALFPQLLSRGIDIVHFSEGNVGNVLARLAGRTGARIKLLQSNGGPISPRHFRPEVLIHQVSKVNLEEALEYGIKPERMHLVPYGIEAAKFRPAAARDRARDALGIPRDKFIALSVAALNSSHKRLDYLIREMAILQDPRLVFCMAGEPTSETPELRRLAEQMLPGQHMFLTLSRAQIPDLLSCADLFVLASLNEGFGMVLLEALAAGSPVIAHRSEHFSWILGDSALYADMSVNGALSSLIGNMIARPDLLSRLSEKGKQRIQAQFDWELLLPRYLAMYEAVHDH